MRWPSRPKDDIAPPIPRADPAHPEALAAYLRRSGAGLTEEEIRSAASAAGYTDSQIDVALAGDGEGLSDIDRGPVVRNALAAYGAVYIGLMMLLLLNPSNPGNGHTGHLSTEIFASLLAFGAGFGVSYVWIASPRGFMYLVGVVIVFVGMLGGQLWPIVGGVATVIGARRTRLDTTLSGEGSEAAFLSMPLLILALIGASSYNAIFT